MEDLFCTATRNMRSSICNSTNGSLGVSAARMSLQNHEGGQPGQSLPSWYPSGERRTGRPPTCAVALAIAIMAIELR
ncbi:hypothetical protein IG631_15108 [Alternaria alternata]|nr:hypothetical protein IG631_15108 [Alternaria alternata]